MEIEKFTWVPFYKELASALLNYKDNRTELIKWIYDDLGNVKSVGGNSLTKYLHMRDNSPIQDIDPFSVFAIFNRSLSWEKRFELIRKFKNHFNLNSDIPKDLNGIPVLDPRRAFFFSWDEDNHKVITDQWTLFEKVLKGEDISITFNNVLENGMPRYSLTMCLFWINPDVYLALDSTNRLYLKKYGVTCDYPVMNYSIYSNLLMLVNKKMESGEIPVNSFLDISYTAWENTSNSKSEKLPTNRQYWLAGYSYGGDRSQFDRFIKEGFWDCGYDENKPTDQKQIAETRTISVGDIIVLKSSSTKGPNHSKPFLRVKAVGVVTSDVIVTDEGKGKKGCRCSVDYINTDERDFNGSVYGHYRKTIHRADSKVKEIIDYVTQLLNEDIMPQKKYQKYIDLLQETHNLVLTGAPGTGKTYMAQKIADEMGAVTKFVQFHPSYDYTDFVEGLRPKEKEDGQMGFERRDGVFKEFCREAIKNLIDSEKSIESLSNELSWQEQLDLFIEDAMECGYKFSTVNGSEFFIKEMKGHNIVINNEQNEISSQVYVNADEILELLINNVSLNIVRDIRNYFNRKYGTQADSYAYVIIKEVRAMKKKAPVVTANKVDEKPFVFIIDEINRGEASKIFGELFYAIDPGYRDKKDHLIQTQYQNLVSETDVFAKGFYVPENVYILATMNDIDRSVESMDFAMRRRFTWQEVTPDDTESMLDSLPCVTEAKETMHRLNKVIAETEGLGAAYMIGPSYFLKLRENGGDFEKLWKMNIEPLLKEYLRGFRKSTEILEKFSKAYFDDKETTTGNLSLEDED